MTELLDGLPADLKWAITHIHILDNGVSLAQAIIDGSAVAVSDASYKDLFGTAALVIEGPPSSHRANAVNITPGPIKEGDSTRCETGGLIGIMVLTMAICTVHKVTTGSIVIACDNINSIRIFQPDFVPDPNEESFDLVSCLHSLAQQSPVTLKPEHVTGHQKGKKQPHLLTRLELLNEEMDNSAKAYWKSLAEHRTFDGPTNDPSGT